MKPKPLTEAQKAYYKQHVREKTFPLRVRFFAELCVKILFWIGVLALVGYGGVYVWALVYTKNKADRIEQRIHDKILETQRDSYPE